MLEKSLPVGYKHGTFRPYATSRPLPGLVAASHASVDHLYTFIAFATAIIVRLYKLPSPPKVVFDEVHLGGFAQDYFHGDFFIDVHPPLVKLTYLWIAKVFGWDGKFPFLAIGDVYDNNVPYIHMRLFSAVCGALTVPLTYGILRASRCRPWVAFVGAFLVLIENTFVTQSRFILVDGPLLLFTSLTVFAFKRFQLQTAFSLLWAKFLVLTGVGLGLTVSSKLTGLFTVAWVGAFTLVQLWTLLGDLEVLAVDLIKHVVARALALVAVPVTIYLSLFYVHFAQLRNDTSASGAVSPAFRLTLAGSDDVTNSPVEVSYGSTITIKHNNQEGYLHSHKYNYPGGSGEQQVTLYGYNRDLNNEWIIETRTKNYEGKLQQKFKPIKDGDVVRLFHKQTGKYLHVNDVRPPISEHEHSNEVSCHGLRDDLGGDTNYEWKVRTVLKKPWAPNNLPLLKLRAGETVFQLLHRGTSCVLMSHKEKLPKWGYGQNEVLCVNEPTIPNSLWYIETNSHPVLDEDERRPRVAYGSVTFWHKLREYHRAMFRINSSLTDDHDFSSSPETWPFVLRGINFFSNSDTDTLLTDETGSHVYLIGNAAIFYSAVVVLVITAFKLGFYALRHLNPFDVVPEPHATYYQGTIEWAAAWFLHYFPYFHMHRQLFLHHYLPALFFSILLVAQYLEHQVATAKWFGYPLVVVVVGLAAYTFYTFIPVVYGTPWDITLCLQAKWMASWDLDCIAYTRK